MAETIPSTSTFDALTADYTPKILVDNIFVGTPTLQKLRQNIQPVAGRAWQPLVEYASMSGEWYSRGSVVADTTTLADQIAMRATYSPLRYRLKVILDRGDVKMQGAQGLVDLMKSYINNATKSMAKDLSTAIFTTTGSAVNTIADYCDSAATVGGLAPGSYAWWKAHVVEGESDGATNFGKQVSPSVDNVERLIQDIVGTTGEKPDLLVCAEELWNCLAWQLKDKIQLQQAANATNDIIRWGFATYFIDGVPVISDRNCPGEAWVAGQATRANAKGYQLYAINWKHLKLGVWVGESFKWDESGWRKPVNLDGYLNYLYFWGQLGTDSRRTLGGMYNIDTAQDESEYDACTVDRPG